MAGRFRWWPWHRTADASPAPSRRAAPTDDLTAIVRYARRTPAATDDPAAERDAAIADLQAELARLCAEPTPLMQRLHLYLTIIEAECSIRIHRGTLPLTNEEFEQLLRGIRAVDGVEEADRALELRKSLVDAGYIRVPPRVRKGRRVAAGR